MMSVWLQHSTLPGTRLTTGQEIAGSIPTNTVNSLGFHYQQLPGIYKQSSEYCSYFFTMAAFLRVYSEALDADIIETKAADGGATSSISKGQTTSGL